MVVGSRAIERNHRPQPQLGRREPITELGEWGALHRAAAAERSRILSHLCHRHFADPALPPGRGGTDLSGSDSPASLAALADRSIRHSTADAKCRLSLNIVYRRIDELKPDPANPRRHTKQQIRKIADTGT